MFCSAFLRRLTPHTKKVDHVQGCVVHFKHNEFNSCIFTLLFCASSLILSDVIYFENSSRFAHHILGDDVLNSFFQFMFKRDRSRMIFVGGRNKLGIIYDMCTIICDYFIYLFKPKWAKYNEPCERCEWINVISNKMRKM